MTDTAISNGVAMELFPIVEAPISINLDKNNIEKSSHEPDPVASSNIVGSVTGAHKVIITSPIEENPYTRKSYQ